MFSQTRLGTFGITPNDNICFPVGTIFAVQGQYEKLDFPAVFGKYKKKGRDLNSLIMALVSYKLYLRILVLGELGKWINHGEILDIFGLGGFAGEPSLDGMAYLETAHLCDYHAIRWMLAHLFICDKNSYGR